ncbi:MAG: DEAD/DEAH box helicase [bacterium]|nr:DEAD/DEAH box helicase [bacterium]
MKKRIPLPIKPPKVEPKPNAYKRTPKHRTEWQGRAMRLNRLAAAIEHDSLLRGTLIYREELASEPAAFREPSLPLRDPIRLALKKYGVSSLYSHQAEAIDLVQAGRDIVVVTPTASGKSLTYILPLLNAVSERPDSAALLLFPLKALEQDQAAKLRQLQQELRGELDFSLAIFDGDTPSSERQKIKKTPPNFLITNPDMLHQGMLAYHQSWEKFFRRLRFIVIDELHAYRGVFGSHILQVFRRLKRLLYYYGAQPQFICLSATIANPDELASQLTGCEPVVIRDLVLQSPNANSG